MMCESLNSAVVPLFEKTLTASDVGRLGRMVLPKSCVEVSLVTKHLNFALKS